MLPSRRVALATSDGKRRETGGVDEDGWTREQVHALRVAMKTHPSSIEKKERFRLIAEDVGKTRRECYDKAKALRAKAQAKRAKQASQPSSLAPSKEGSDATKDHHKRGHRHRHHGHGRGRGHGHDHRKGADAAKRARNPDAASNRRGGGGGGGDRADALDALLGPTGRGRGGSGHAPQQRQQQQQQDDGWGDMLSHVKSTVSGGTDDGAPLAPAKAAGGTRVGRRSEATPRRARAPVVSGGWGSPGASQGRAGAGAGAGGAGAFGSRTHQGSHHRRGPRVDRHGVLIIEDDGVESEEEAHQGGGGGSKEPDSPPAAPGWGHVMRAAPDESSLFSKAKRNDAGELVIEDADNLEADFDAAPGMSCFACAPLPCLACLLCRWCRLLL